MDYGGELWSWCSGYKALFLILAKCVGDKLMPTITQWCERDTLKIQAGGPGSGRRPGGGTGTKKAYWVRHTDNDAHVIRHYGPTTKDDAERRAARLNETPGHKGEVISKYSEEFDNGLPSHQLMGE